MCQRGDAQLILGHSQISITQEIYQHVDMDSRRSALERMESLFSTDNQNDGVSRQAKPSFGLVRDVVGWMISGGAVIKEFKPQLDEFRRWRVLLDKPYNKHVNR